MCPLLSTKVEVLADVDGGEEIEEVATTKASRLRRVFPLLDLAKISDFPLPVGRCVFGSRGSGRGFFIGPSNQKEGYNDGGDGGRIYEDLDTELEGQGITICVRDTDDGVLFDALGMDMVLDLGFRVVVFVERLDDWVVVTGNIPMDSDPLEFLEINVILRNQDILRGEVEEFEDDELAGEVYVLPDVSMVGRTCKLLVPP